MNTPFQFPRLFPFTVPNWTQQQCDNYSWSGDPNITKAAYYAAQVDYFADEEGYVFQVQAGRIKALSRQQVCKIFWNVKGIKWAVGYAGAEIISASDLGLVGGHEWDGLTWVSTGIEPRSRAAFAQASSWNSTFYKFDGTGYYTYRSLILSKIAYNVTEASYEVFVRGNIGDSSGASYSCGPAAFLYGNGYTVPAAVVVALPYEGTMSLYPNYSWAYAPNNTYQSRSDVAFEFYTY